MNNTQLFKKAIAKGFILKFADIETSPPLSYNYGNRKVNIPHNNIVCPKQITSIGYMEEGDSKATVIGWDAYLEKDGSYDLLRNDRDKALIEKTLPALLDCDLIIGQNSDKFDWPEIQARACILRLPPLITEHFLSLDILKMSRKTMRYESQKLDARSRIHGCGGKIDQDMQDAIDVAMGNSRAQKIRMEYNAKDVIDTRKVFWAELDYYTLPKGLIRLLQLYIKDNSPDFCMKCAAKKQARFDISNVRHKGEIRVQCNRCEFIWRRK